MNSLTEPLLLLTFNPTRKRRPYTFQKLHWSQAPSDPQRSIYPPLFNRKEVK
jgi:hypothetical protein